MKKKISIVFTTFLCILLFSNERLIPFSLNGKIGFVDEKLKILREPEYKGEVISYNNQMIKIKCKGYSVIIGNNGELLTRGVDSLFIVDKDKYVISQNDGSYFSRMFSSEKQALRVFDKIKINDTDHKGNLMIVDGRDNSSSRYNIINLNGDLLYKNNKFKRIFDYNSEKKIAFVQDNDFNDCLVDSDGKIINTVPFQFGMRSMSEGYIFGKNLKTGECGFFDMDCKLVLKAGVKKGSTMDDWNCYPGINCGVVALVNDGEKNILLSEWQTFHSDNWSIVDSTGRFIESGVTADKIYPFSDDVAVLMIQNGENTICRLIGKNGKIITDRDFDQISSSVNGYCMAEQDGVDYLIKAKDGSVYRCSEF